MRCVKLVSMAVLLFSMRAAFAIVPGGLVAHVGYGSGSASSMSIDLTINHEPPADSSHFWAQQFYTSTTIDHGGYFGLQTGGVINGVNVGKMVIFSIWNAVDAQAYGSAVAQQFGGEGVGYSVRLPFDWKSQHNYTFNLHNSYDEWWELSIDGLALGAIRITQNVPLQSVFPGFTEYFRDLPGCDDLPYTRATFGNLVYGSQHVAITSAYSYGNCLNHASGTVFTGGSVKHAVGTGMPENCNGKTITVDFNVGQTATAGNDVILGTAGPDVIRGKAGNDTICGMGGDDFIHGNSGDDWIDGGEGSDDLRGGRGDDYIYTGPGSTAGTASRAFGGYDTDHIFGDVEADDLRGGKGTDYLYGGDDADEITGNDGDDQLYGGRGHDTLRGGQGDDQLFGDPGGDSLNGGGGSNDLCDAGGDAGDIQINCEM